MFVAIIQATLKRDLELVKDASTFLQESMVPRFVHDCIQLLVTPMDGEALTVAMHARGINMRYLGQLAKLAVLRDDLQHLLVSIGSCGNQMSNVFLFCFILMDC